MQQLGGIEVGVLPANGPVQVGAGDAAGGAAEAEFVSGFNVLAFFHIHAAEVHGERVETEAVIDDDAVPFEIKMAGEDDDSAV